MYNIVGYEENDQEEVVAFLKKAQADIQPDFGILARSILIKDAKGVVGMVSYGECGDMGIVRYFLYDADLSGTDLIVDLFFELYRKAYSEGKRA